MSAFHLIKSEYNAKKEKIDENKFKQQLIKNNMGHSDYFVVISNGYAQVTRPDGGVKFTIHESGAIGAGMSPNGEYFVVGFKDRTTIY